MGSVWKTFRAARLGGTAIWAFSVTSLASLLGHGVARADVVTCPTSPITATGGSTTTSPDTGNVACDNTEITGSQTFPAYWEFTWNDQTGPATISANITSTGDQGSFTGDLELWDSTGATELTSASFYLPGSIGSTADVSISYNLTNGTNYVVGLDAPTSDPSFAITFTDTPEPASFGIFGGALAVLGYFRGRRGRSG